MKNAFRNSGAIFQLLRKDKQLRSSLLANIKAFLRAVIKVRLSGKYDRLVVISLTEHLGDIVACEPTTYHLRKLFPKSYIIWIVNKSYLDLVRYNPNIQLVMQVSSLSEWVVLKKVVSPFATTYDFHINGKRCSKHNFVNRNSASKIINLANYLEFGNLLQTASMAAGITEMPDYAPRFHFKPNLEYEPPAFSYIVVHTLSNYETRNWKNENWNELVHRLLATYPHLHVMEIGLEGVIKSSSARFHNVTGKLGLQEIASLIRSSTLFIGVESGFAHVANAVNKEGVVLIGHFYKFTNYMVYSGAYANESIASLMYYDGPVRNLGVEVVAAEAIKRLQPFFNPISNSMQEEKAR